VKRAISRAEIQSLSERVFPMLPPKYLVHAAADDLRARLDEILRGRESWASYQEGLILRQELVSLIAAHIVSWVEDVNGLRQVRWQDWGVESAVSDWVSIIEADR
jgi:hypothetical protein